VIQLTIDLFVVAITELLHGLWQALMEAIKAVTEMNPDLSVEKIEIQTNAERV